MVKENKRTWKARFIEINNFPEMEKGLIDIECCNDRSFDETIEELKMVAEEANNNGGITKLSYKVVLPNIIQISISDDLNLSGEPTSYTIELELVEE